MRDRFRHVPAAWFLLAVLSTGITTDATPAHADQPDSLFHADIYKLMEMTGTAKVGEQMAVMASGNVINVFRTLYPDIPPQTFDVAQRVAEEEFARAFHGPDGLLKRIVPIYAKYFSHDDVRGLIAFYETKLGRKTIEVMPQLMVEGAQVGRVWGEEIAPRIQQRVEERLRSDGLL